MKILEFVDRFKAMFSSKEYLKDIRLKDFLYWLEPICADVIRFFGHSIEASFFENISQNEWKCLQKKDADLQKKVNTSLRSDY